jgi:ribosome-associated protein
MGEALRVTENLTIPELYLVFETMGSGGKGGQHAQKNDTRVRLRFDLEGCSVLSPAVKERIRQSGVGQLVSSGELLLVCERHRSRVRNMADVRERLSDVIRQALRPPKRRKATRPSRAQRQRRLASKRQRSARKQGRKKVDPS